MDRAKQAIENLVSAERVISSALPADDLGLGKALAPGAWSPAEHLLHCALINEMVAQRFRELLAGAPSGPPPTDLKKSLMRRVLFATWRIPEGRKAPGPVVPLVILPRAQLLARLRSSRDELIALSDCAAQSRAQLWVEHPILGPFSFREWVTFIQIHSQHHRRLILKQLPSA